MSDLFSLSEISPETVADPTELPDGRKWRRATGRQSGSFQYSAPTRHLTIRLSDHQHTADRAFHRAHRGAVRKRVLWHKPYARPSQQSPQRCSEPAIDIVDLVHVCPLAAILAGLTGPDTAVEFANTSKFLHSHANAMKGRFTPPFAHKVYLLGGIGPEGRPLSSAEFYDTSTGRWAPLPPMASRRMLTTAAAIAGRVFVIGGLDRVDNFGLTQALRSVECFDVAACAWSTLPPMASPRCAAAATSLLDRVYVMGGQDGQFGESQASAEYYDTRTEAWVPLPPMANARSGATGAAYAGKVFAIGGLPGDEQGTLAAERYDLRTGMWGHVKAIESLRTSSAIGVFPGRVCLFGGVALGGSDIGQEMASAVCHNVTTSTVMPLLRMEGDARACAMAATVGTTVYVLGGTFQKHMLESVVCYDSVRDTWESLPSMQNTRIWAGVACLQQLP